VNTQPFSGIPFNGNPLAHVTEFQASARQTRVSVLAETKIANAKVSGYEEAEFPDFLRQLQQPPEQQLRASPKTALGASGPRKRIYVHRPGSSGR